jgi:hypothetical protein
LEKFTMAGNPDDDPLLCQNRADSLASGLLSLDRRLAGVRVAENPLPMLRNVLLSAQTD